MAYFHSLPPFSLLLVEDDITARKIISRMVALKFPQCTMFTAEHGEEGVKLFMEHAPDLVVTDINMPIMDGIEMVRKIKAMNPNATYIIISARERVDQFEEIGYCAFLRKPLDFNELLYAIQNCHPELRQKGKKNNSLRQMFPV